MGRGQLIKEGAPGGLNLSVRSLGPGTSHWPLAPPLACTVAQPHLDSPSPGPQPSKATLQSDACLSNKLSCQPSRALRIGIWRSPNQPQMCRQPHTLPRAKKVVLGSARREASGTQLNRTEPSSLPRGEVPPSWVGSCLLKQHSSPLSRPPHHPRMLSSDLSEPVKVPDAVTLPHVSWELSTRFHFCYLYYLPS